MINLRDVLYLALATFAITYMITQTAGPFDAFSWLREHSPAILKQLLTCYYCLAAWIALIGIFIYPSVIGREIIMVLAITGAAYIAHKLT